MNENVKALIDFAATVAEVLALFVASFAPVAPLVKLGLCSFALTSMTLRFIANRKRMKEDNHVES
ncbi:MAG: hypothetical protein AB1644_08375 [Candidatus Zixiibacteriota bacterium]